MLSTKFIQYFFIIYYYFYYCIFYYSISGVWIYNFIDTSNKYWGVFYTIVISFWIAFGYVFTIIHEKKNLFTSEIFGRKKHDEKEDSKSK